MICQKTPKDQKISILDVGTGSGAIAIALAYNIPNAKMYASDFSEKALAVAIENSRKNGVQITFLKHNILIDSIESLPNDLNLIVSNPPYIPMSVSKELHRNVLNYEPHSALFVPDQDPILFYKKIAEISLKKLKNGGTVFFETFELFHDDIVQYMNCLGFSNIQSIKDINDKNRFITAEKNVYLH